MSFRYANQTGVSTIPLLAVPATLVLSGCYWMLFVATLILSLCFSMNQTKAKNRSFYILIAVVSLLRGFFWSMQMTNVLIQIPDGLYHAWWTFPSLLLLTTYSFLVSYWAQIYHESSIRGIVKPSVTRKMRRYITIAFNIIIYSGELGLVIYWVFLCKECENVISYIQPYYITICYFSVIAFFVIYGFLLYSRESRNVLQSSAIMVRRVKLVVKTSVIITLAFTIRSSINLYIPFSKYLSGGEWWNYFFLFYTTFYIACEVLPITVVLFLITRLPRQYKSILTPAYKSEGPGPDTYNSNIDEIERVGSIKYYGNKSAYSTVI
eukprot:TRINITY_DN3937_c1_g1_i1.p1 TRINITY_DN3937_c1_g1~~TRINITY_DN3937_c1_g1_i1.p1  ORF type:complete len:322 (-),score=11.08 TRINITY_DN3937_c1_g1_i1:61-1026(-)